MKRSVIIFSYLFLVLTNFVSTSAQEKNCIATNADEKLFNDFYNAGGQVLFFDDCKGNWRTNWSLDGKIGYVENSPEGMALHSGPELKNDAHHVVLWTKKSFTGDLIIEYD